MEKNFDSKKISHIFYIEKSLPFIKNNISLISRIQKNPFISTVFPLKKFFFQKIRKTE
jgi:hypothetical protein